MPALAGAALRASQSVLRLRTLRPAPGRRQAGAMTAAAPASAGRPQVALADALDVVAAMPMAAMRQMLSAQCRRARRRQGPVLAILAMLASLEAKRRVAAGCCALPLTSAALRRPSERVGTRGVRPSLRSGVRLALRAASNKGREAAPRGERPATPSSRYHRRRVESQTNCGALILALALVVRQFQEHLEDKSQFARGPPCQSMSNKQMLRPPEVRE
jgi:hypothetical protein